MCGIGRIKYNDKSWCTWNALLMNASFLKLPVTQWYALFYVWDADRTLKQMQLQDSNKKKIAKDRQTGSSE